MLDELSFRLFIYLPLPLRLPVLLLPFCIKSVFHTANMLPYKFVSILIISIFECRYRQPQFIITARTTTTTTSTANCLCSHPQTIPRTPVHFLWSIRKNKSFQHCHSLLYTEFQLKLILFSFSLWPKLSFIILTRFLTNSDPRTDRFVEHSGLNGFQLITIQQPRTKPIWLVRKQNICKLSDLVPKKRKIIEGKKASIFENKAEMSGVGYMTSVKTVNTSIRRRRRCDRHHLELSRCSGGDQPDLIPHLDSIPATPITPPAAFLPPGFKRLSTKGETVENFHHSQIASGVANDASATSSLDVSRNASLWEPL